MSGSSPLPDVVTRSIGTGSDGFSFLRVSMSACTRSINALFEGPRFDWLPSLSPPCPSYSARLSSRRAIGK